jgi:hypothetical protein
MKSYRAPRSGAIFLSGLAAVGSVLDPRLHTHNEARATFIEPLTYDLGGTATFDTLTSAFTEPEFNGWPPGDFDVRLRIVLKAEDLKAKRSK